MHIKTVDMGEVEGIKNVYPLHPIVKNDILQMSLHVFFASWQERKAKVEQFQSNGMKIVIVLL